MQLKFSYSLKSVKEKLTSLVAKISFGYWVYDVKLGKVYKPVRCFPGIKVDPQADWDEKKHLPRSKAKLGEIAAFEKMVESVYRLMDDQEKEITNITFKVEIDLKLKRTVEVDRMRIRIVDFIEDHIETSDLNEETIGKYEDTKERIKKFEKEIGKPLYATDVNSDIYLLYTEFIRNIDTVKKNNTVVTYVKNLISALNKIARHYKIAVFNPSKELDKKDQIKATKEDKVYLTFDDIIKVIRHTPSTERLKNVRLIFLTLFFTGCRFGDVFKIKPEEFYKQGSEEFYYCRFLTDKNNKEVIIPILEPLMAEFRKNNGPAKFTHLSDFDLMIKDLIRDCGIDRHETLTVTNKKGHKEFDKRPFYQFVSSHTGRRSFITNLLNYVPIPILCKITTHELKDKSIIFIYDQTTLIQNAVLFVRHLLRATFDFKDAFPLKLVK